MRCETSWQEARALPLLQVLCDVSKEVRQADRPERLLEASKQHRQVGAATIRVLHARSGERLYQLSGEAPRQGGDRGMHLARGVTGAFRGRG